MSAPKPVAFLFLGETLLLPHLYPIVEAIAEIAPDVPVDLWVATSVHEDLVAGWLSDAGLGEPLVRIRRAPGYRVIDDVEKTGSPLVPAKLPMLARLTPYLLSAWAVVCAEQTSLWLPRLLPLFRRRFLKTSHGVGSMSARDDARRRAARLLLVPSEREKETYLARGYRPDRLVVTGYVKSAFRGLARPRRMFPNDKPVLLYAPHWQRHRSSWWDWGRQIVAMLASQDRFNVILAPHQRLVEQDPGVRAVLDAVAHLPHVHTDLDSFAMVDGTYLAAADVYLGDTSSQVVEFLGRPRPCIFLDPAGIDWRATDDHEFWTCGDVVTALPSLTDALDHVFEHHARYARVQRRFADHSLGVTGVEAPRTAARAVLSLLPANAHQTGSRYPAETSAAEPRIEVRA